MRSLSLKIILNDGAVTRVIKFPPRATAGDACRAVQEKVLTGEAGKDFGLFLPSADDDLSGIWLDEGQELTHYLLRDGDSLHYRSKVRTLRLRTLDGAVKTIQVDESQPVQSLMMTICARFGITNYEEYGLRREEVPEEVVKPATGTLTLRRKPKTREKDLAMDQLSKKLKTDDNVLWLEQHKTLRENTVPADAALLLQRRLFYSDRKVDSRDPVQLSLLYIQERDALKADRHHVAESKAVEFAGIQCQVEFGDHQEDKHKPGFIENLKDFLPETYASSRGIEKKIFKEHRKHAGLSEIDAKFLYTKTARELPTYGVTFFLVKETVEGKKKLVPRLLGISANSVLRMDETTKEILDEWPLTQVKTYKAGKGELFTLNFGEYSDKEYCVKTNDAYRIRDILQAYIDLIRKKMAAPFNAVADDGGAIYSATVESSKGSMMEVVTHSATKAVETSFTGPSRIVAYEHGATAQAQGAQIMTAHQVVVMSRQHNQQNAVTGGAALRNARGMSAGAVRRLNDLNGHAVRIVQLLTEPNSANVEEAKKVIEIIQEGMPSLVEGIQQCIKQQPDDASRQKLTLELNELQNTVEELARFKSPTEAEAAAMKVADLTTQMYFALDPATLKRGQLVRSSRKSFIEDERTQATLQRASFINTVAAASEAIDAAKDILNKEYDGPELRPAEARARGRSALDKMARLNAAIARFAAAHSDPKNIDYGAAVNAMNTIKELLPELAKDVQALGTVDDEVSRPAQRRGMQELCDAVQRVCGNTGCDDLQKLHDAANDYAKKSKRLYFTFSRGEQPEKESEILSLAKAADDKARVLLLTAEHLTNAGDGDAAETLRAAARRCGDAACGLRACARLTAPSIHDPHCRSAISAASEDLASSAQAVAAACRPILEQPGSPHYEDTVKQQTADLIKALAMLNAACEADDNPSPAEERERRRLQFTNTTTKAREALDGCDAVLNDKRPATAPDGWLGDSLPRRLAALNAALVALAAATRDTENPDYAEAETAMAAIQHLMPAVINDATWYSSKLPEPQRKELLDELGALCDAVRALTNDGQNPDALAAYAKASGKLTYVFDRSAKPENEHRIIELAKSCCEKTSELLADVYRAVDAAGGAAAERLDAAGAGVAEAAEALLTAASLTAPTAHIPRSAHALHGSAMLLSRELQNLAHAWTTAAEAQQLNAHKKLADEEIEKLLDALMLDKDAYQEDPVKQKKRVRFAFSLSQTGGAIEEAEKDIDKPITSQALTAAQTEAARRSLADKLAALNAAIAALAAGTQDRANPDFEAVEKATSDIQQLLPQVVEESRALASGKDEAGRLAALGDLRALCAALAGLNSGALDSESPSSAAVAEYARAAARLNFICTPRDAKMEEKERKVMAESSAVCEQSSELLAAAHRARAPEHAARAAAGAARALQDAAQLTSSSLHSAPCRSALLRAAAALSDAVARLDAACSAPGHSALAQHRRAFDDAVEELMRTIRSLEGDTQEATSPEREKRRLKFVATRNATQHALDDAARELDKAGKSAPLAPPQASAMQLSLSDRLATLNAAIAALLAATRDPEKPDYEAAESASATIQELIPDLVKDAKTLSSGKDAAARDSLLKHLRALCEATSALHSGNNIGKDQDLHEEVKKFTTASGHLVYVFNPRADSAKENQIIELSKSTCERSSELLAGVYTEAQEAEARRGEALDASGAKFADAAQGLLTTAELTAPCISSPLCQSSLLTAVDGLSSALEQLALAWQPGSAALVSGKTRVEEAVEKLREAIRSGQATDSATEVKRGRLRFTNSLASTKAALDAAEKGLEQPAPSPPTAPAAASLRRSLADRLAALNAAILTLVAATRDPENPNYEMAETASTTIRELMPDIVKDVNTVSSSDPAREELLREVHALCEATRRLGTAAGQSPEDLDEAATQFSVASNKLDYVFRPQIDHGKANQMIESCRAAREKTSELLQNVHLVAVHQGDDALDRQMAVVSDAAKALLTTAQLTAHTAPSRPSQTALSEAAGRLHSSLQGLQAAWAPLVQAPGGSLLAGTHAVEMELQKVLGLIRECEKETKVKPAVPARASPARAAASASVVGDTKQFLDALRKEASIGVSEEEKKALARVEEEKLAKARFNQSVEEARKSICTAQNDLKKYIKSESKPRALNDQQINALNKQLEHKLARANAAAAHLLTSRGTEKSDYAVASKCVTALSDLLPAIVVDAKTLGDSKDAKAREAFLQETLKLCAASEKLCEADKDNKKLKDSALSFGTQTSKLLYAVSTDVDPSQENQVLIRVKTIGDAMCRVTASDASAARCASLATVFMYTAKLVAPSIQDPECQAALLSPCKGLSTELKAIPASPELANELAALQKALEDLQRDVAGGTLVKRKEQLVIEDTPFRRVAMQIIEHAKQNAECTERSAEARRAAAAFANELTDALKALDVANARCRNAPHDMRLRADMENALYETQELVLRRRPGAAPGAVVDLANYLSAASTDSEHLQQAASSPTMAGSAAARTAAALAAHALAARARAERARTGGDVDGAAQECVSKMRQISTALECCPEVPEKTVLKKAAQPLYQSCALLQFAAQSSRASGQCVALDAAIADLTELEARVEGLLQPAEDEGPAQAPSPSLPAARARLGAAAARGAAHAQLLAPALTRYAATLRLHTDVRDEQKRRRLAEHLKRLQASLKLMAMETSRRLQTWSSPAAVDRSLKELDNMEAVIGVQPNGAARVAPADYKNLLLPAHTYVVEGDSKQLEAKLESSATKLNSMTETLTLSVGKPESLARTAHLTSESAVQLAAIARAMKSDEDPSKASRIEETSDELCFVTYNLLKTAESVSHEPNSFRSRRRLQDACRSLTDAINKLVRTTSSADKLHRECNELTRSLQLHVQPQPTCALSYTDCVAAVHSQHDTIQNLPSDKEMSREEFSTSLQVLAAAVRSNVEYAEHCAYLLSIAGKHPELAKEGVLDAARIQRLVATAQDTCFKLTSSGIELQAEEESSLLAKQLSDLKQAVDECAPKAKEPEKQQLLEASSKVTAAGDKVLAILNSGDVSANKLTPSAFAAVSALSRLADAASRCAPPTTPTKTADQVIDRSKELLTRTAALMRAVRTADKDPMTWVMFNSGTKGVVDSSDQLIICLKTNGQDAGILEATVVDVEEETDMAFKSYVQTQVAIANKWLNKPTFKPQIKAAGEAAARNVIDIGKKMSTHLRDAEAEEMRHLAEECEPLLDKCLNKYDQDTASVLLDRLRDVARATDRGLVAMVVEDLVEEEEPLADLETLVDAETDEAKRKYLLEQKIKDLLAHLARVNNTARAVAAGRGAHAELETCSQQTSLLAPMLVKAAEKRVIFPAEKAVVEEYHTQLAQYSESLSRVRDLCDRAVDPMQFVQAAEEKMQHMKEESITHQNDLQKYSNTSAAIRNLANRVISVSMSSLPAQRDPELMRALAQAQARLAAAAPAAFRASRRPDWDHGIAEILRATGEVESVLGGEMIFNKLPEPDQPIYNAARNLHAAVREWSARDNEIVAEAKRMAVLMAKLSDHMHADKKREVISTAKAIVAASHEVARLARKLALECTDERLRTNLLQFCDQILMISAQLKMLSNVKNSSFGHQGTEEDIEAMNMLVGNAQNLMTTIQDTVSASFGASVKIRAQRGGPRLRWVRKNYASNATPVLTF